MDRRRPGYGARAPALRGRGAGLPAPRRLPGLHAVKGNPLHYYQPSRSPRLARELAPGRELECEGRILRINRWGIREDGDDPASDAWRVAVLGDSVVFGVGSGC